MITVAVSCGKNKEVDSKDPIDPDPTNQVVDASINAATKSFVISGSDIPVAFTIDAASEVLTDAVFEVKAEGDIDHELTNKTLTITKGGKTISGELIIKSSAKKKGSVRISITSTNTDIKVVNKEVVINLTEKPIDIPSGYCNITVSYNAYSSIKAFSIGDKKEENIAHDKNKGWADRTSEVIMLPTGASTISLTYQQGTTGNGDPYVLVAWIDLNGNGNFSDPGERVLYEEFLADGDHTVTAKLDVPVDAAKSGVIRFGTYFRTGKTTLNKDTGCGNIDSGDLIDIAYNLVEGVLLPDLSISATNTNIVLDDTDISQEIEVSLSKAIDKDLVVLLSTKGGFEGACEIPASVTIPANQTSATANIKFFAKAFPAEDITADIVLSVDPEDEMLANVGNNGRITFNVKGSGTAIIATIAFEETTIKVGSENGVAKYTITLSDNATKNSNINVDISGADATYIGSAFASTVTIPMGSNKATGEITLLATGFEYVDIVKTIVAKISSSDVIVNPNSNSASVKVNGSKTGLIKPKLALSALSPKMVIFPEGNKESTFKVGNRRSGGNVVLAPEDITFNLRINGATEGVHYTIEKKQFILKKGESEIGPMKITWLKNGFAEGEKEIIDVFVDIVSGYATADDYSIQYAVERLVPGVYCPIVPDAPQASKYGALRGYSVGTLSTTDIATLSYQNLTSTPTTIKKGANTFTVTVGTDSSHAGDAYSVAMYIDWNGNGNFADEGENYSTPSFAIGEAGNTQVKTFTITPPENATQSSRIRFGLAFKDYMTDGCIGKFEAHKIVDMTYQLEQ